LQYDIAGNIMTRKRIQELRDELAAFRRCLGSIKPRELVSIAESIGRKPANRGKEPTWAMPGFFPFSIPQHPGTLKKGTARNIIASLEEDLDEFERRLDQEDGPGNGHGQERGQ
jgi:hypothetical protein